MHLKQRCILKLYFVGLIAPNDIPQPLLKVYGDQRVDGSIVRQWEMRGDNDMYNKLRAITQNDENVLSIMISV